MRTLCIVVCALACAQSALAQNRERMVVVSTGRLVVLGDRHELREHLARADKAIADAIRKARQRLLEDLLGNARNRLDNAREFLGLEPEELQAQAIQKEGREDDERLADTVVSENLVVTDLASLFWEIGRADYNLSKVEGELGTSRPDVATLVEQARAEVSVTRELLTGLVGELALPKQSPPSAPRADEALALPHGPIGFPPAEPQAMSEPTFQALLAAIEREGAAEDRLRVLETAIASQRLLVAQVKEVLARFSFSQQKLKAAQLVKDHIADAQNEFQLYSVLTFESDKEALRKILGSGELETPRPIDNPAFDQLMARVREGWASQVGFQVLRDEAPKRWFLVDQVATLLGVFPTFEARFRALQSLRARILDPENWMRLEPLFATMEDRARLRSLFAPSR